MSADKYPSIFSRQIETIVYIIPETKLRAGIINLLLTGPYRGILARGRGSTDRAQRGPYKTTEGQYSPVRLELARLVSSLLYGTLG